MHACDKNICTTKTERDPCKNPSVSPPPSPNQRACWSVMGVDTFDPLAAHAILVVLVAIRRRKWELHASAKNKSADPSVPSKKSSSNSSSNSGGESGGGGKRPKVSVKQAMQQWSADSLDLRRLKYKRVGKRVVRVFLCFIELYCCLNGFYCISNRLLKTSCACGWLFWFLNPAADIPTSDPVAHMITICTRLIPKRQTPDNPHRPSPALLILNIFMVFEWAFWP